MLSLLCACCCALPNEVTATDLGGAKVVGQLKSLSAESLTLVTADGEKVVPLEQLIDLRWADADTDTQPLAGQVYLLDGTKLSFASLVAEGRSLKIASPAYGESEVPVAQVRAVRFRPLAEATDAWDKLLARVRTKDLLVLPKKKKAGELDPTTGVVGEIGAESLKFVLGGDEIPVKRTRVFGVVYARKPVASNAPFAVEVVGGDRIAASGLEWLREAKAVRLTLAAGGSVDVSSKYLRRIDCSGGKIRYLDEMKPIFHEFTAILPDKLYEQIFKYRVNQTMDGQPLRLGGKKYDRGLWIHSRTTLRYSLGGEFSRFEAVTGIDDDIPRRDKTKARLTIKGDEKVLFDKDIWITDKPKPLKLDVSGAQVLEILVDFGEKSKNGKPPLHAALQDWVDLADAKVLK